MTFLKTTTSAVVLALLGTTAAAESHAMAESDLIRTRDITGGTIYRMDVEMNDSMWDETTMYDAVDAEWNDIGEIEDIVLNTEGQMIGIIAEVGGFLDIGDKHIMIPVENVRLAALDDGEYAYVTNKTEEEIEMMEEVDESFMD